MKPSRPHSVSALRMILAVTLLTVFSCNPPVPRESGPLPHELYIWQRSWDPGPGSVQESLDQAPFRPENVVVLGAEIMFGDLDDPPTTPTTMHVAVDYGFLRESDIPAGIALRIGPYSGPFSSDDNTISYISDLARLLISEATESGLTLSEFQIDFDCAESKLDGYRTWIETLKTAVDPVPITITALPAWIHAPEFRRLINSCDGFVLQVHSLEPPADINDDFTLCDTARALEWINEAAELAGDTPFRVALPTYGYTVRFTDDGRFMGITAEGPAIEIAPGDQMRELRSDPNELADLVASLTTDHPENLDGIIWFRMPVAADKLNWPWQTLTAVIEGRHPVSDLTTVAEKREPGLYDIYLSNNGELDESSVVNISIEWTSADVLAYDVLHGFSITSQGPGEIQLMGPESRAARHIRPGEKWMVAWLRLDPDTEVRAIAFKAME